MSANITPDDVVQIVEEVSEDPRISGINQSDLTAEAGNRHTVSGIQAHEAAEEAAKADRLEIIELDSQTYYRLPDPNAPNARPENSEASDLSQEDSGEIGVIDALQCMKTACEYMHSLLGRSLHEECKYGTPREYFREGRGWTEETLERQYLGWAPKNRGELVTHLHDEEFSREQMLATGLFTETENGSVYCLWKGRYVIPYIYEGNPVFAISRQTDPQHPADNKNGKYDKPKISRDDVPLKEPICGLDSIEPECPVLITEGIADAITAHQCGIPCISPVTTQFSGDTQERLVELLDEYDPPRVYIVQDAERPTHNTRNRDEAELITDRISLRQVGPGLQGAVSTGLYIEQNGIDAYVGTPPRCGLTKVDVDNYLQEWNGDIQALVASLRPVSEHPAANMGNQTRATRAARRARETAEEDEDDYEHEDDEYASSKMWDCNLTDVGDLPDNGRGEHPVEHHGSGRKNESRDYFVVIDDEIAYDHKWNVTYRPLTWILCEMGERDWNRPEGPLDEREVWIAWEMLKRDSVLPADDPVPLGALIHIADKHDLGEVLDETGAETKLNLIAYNAALTVIEMEYNLAPGREHLGNKETMRSAEARALDGNSTLWSPEDLIG